MQKATPTDAELLGQMVLVGPGANCWMNGVTQMEKAQPLTADPAVVMAGKMMVNAVVAQIRPLRAA